MRAGPLSNGKVIELLNRYFVPVYVANQDYGKDGFAPDKEKAEYQRIYHEALRLKPSTGSVEVYILSPDGHPIESLHVATASRDDRLIALLERSVERLKTPAGRPVVEPVRQSRAPVTDDPGALVLHLIARYARRGGSWNEFPSENWLVLKPAEWARLLPSGEPMAGQSWPVDADLATRLLVYFYPQTENNDVSTNRMETQVMTATVVAGQAGMVRVRLDGRLRMKHTFYPGRDDTNVVDAAFVGFVDFDQAQQKIRSLRLVTHKAIYGREDFGVAVRSVP